MANYWNTIKNKFQKEDGIVSVGFSDIVGSGVAAVFWLYIASVMNPSDYGEIHYFLAIAGKHPVYIIYYFNYSNYNFMYNYYHDF